MRVSIFLSFLSKNKTVNVFGILSGLFLLLSVFSGFTDFAFSVYFNSDTLYLPSLYKDLFIDNHYIKDWQLNPAPNFFPDMLLYFIVMFLSGDNFIVTSFVFSIIQYFSVLLLFRYIFKLVMPQHYENYFRIIFILLSFFLLEYLFLGKDFSFTFYLISNSYHSGAFVMALIALIMLFKYFKRAQFFLAIVLFFFSIICVASDKLFIVLFSLPAFCTCVFYFKMIGKKNSLILIITILLSAFIGIKLFEFLEESDFTSFDKPHVMLAFDNIKSSFVILKEQLYDYMSEFSFKSFILYLFFLGIISLFVTFFYTRNKPENLLLNMFIFFSICFNIFGFIAPVINGNYTGYDTLRYNIYPLYFSVLTNAIIITYFLNKSSLKKYTKVGKYAVTVVVILILSIGISFTSRSGLSNYFKYYPETVQKIDEFAEKYQLKCGVANYWDAKKITMFSRKGVKVYSVFEDLGAYEHVTNKKWFFSDNVFNYIVLNNFKDTISYKKYFNKVEIIEKNKGLHVIKVSDFKYEKSKGYWPILIDK